MNCAIKRCRGTSGLAVIYDVDGRRLDVCEAHWSRLTATQLKRRLGIVESPGRLFDGREEVIPIEEY